jgi:hypothetical protein
VADNKTAEGRKENRRVQVQLLSNMSADNTPAPQAAPPTGQAGSMATPPPAPSSDLE